MTAKTVAIEGSGWGWLVRKATVFKKIQGVVPSKGYGFLSNCHFIELEFLVLVWSKKYNVLCV